MTTDDPDASEEATQLNANLARVEELSQRLVQALGRHRPVRPALQGPGQDLYMKAAAAYIAEMMANPSKIIEHQIGYWGKSLKHYVEAQQKLAQGKLEAPEDRSPKDRRFSNPLWETHPYFNYIKQQYLFSSEAIQRAVSDLDGLDEKERKRLEYFSRQIMDMFSPANFLGTNPEALGSRTLSATSRRTTGTCSSRSPTRTRSMWARTSRPRKGRSSGGTGCWS